MQRNYDPLFDVCVCGDYRCHHISNDGDCLICEQLGSRCDRFVLKRTSTKV
jgi:hypothetical protein